MTEHGHDAYWTPFTMLAAGAGLALLVASGARIAALQRRHRTRVQPRCLCLSVRVEDAQLEAVGSSVALDLVDGMLDVAGHERPPPSADRRLARLRLTASDAGPAT